MCRLMGFVSRQKTTFPLMAGVGFENFVALYAFHCDGWGVATIDHDENKAHLVRAAEMAQTSKEFDALQAEHQKMGQENQSLQLQLRDKQAQIANDSQSAVADLAEKQRQFNEQLEFNQDKLIAELRLKKNEADQVLKEVDQGRAELEALKAEIITERRILTAETATITAQLELDKNSGGEETAIKKYEADKKYQAELAKAAASIIMAKMQPKETDGDDKEKDSEEGVKSDNLEKTMARLHEAVLKMAAPKEIVFDEAGNPVGIKPVGDK